MTRHTFFILIIFSLIVFSCSGNKEKTERSKLIPEKDLVPILIDVYTANGLLSLADVRSRYVSFDSITTYITVIEKHGYTKQEMDNTMKYYFYEKPQILIAIYDQVLGVLSKEESLVDKEYLAENAHKENLWTGKESYFFPGISGPDSGQFDIQLKNPGTYTLSYTSTFYIDDQSGNPQFSAYTCNADSIETGKKNFIESFHYLKDSQSHANTVIFKITGNTVLHLKGFLYDFNNNPFICERHAAFQNILLTYRQ
jgi:hypothetical protein